MRRFLYAVLPAAMLLAACGGGGAGSGSGGDLDLALDGPPSGRHAGIYLAISRGYDRAVGVTLRIRDDRADVRLVPREDLDREARVAVMAILPGELYLATDRVTLDERREDVRAAVEAIQRGYEETIVDPESAVAAMVEEAQLDRAALLRDVDRVSPRFKAGGRDFGVFAASSLPPGVAEPLAAPSDR